MSKKRNKDNRGITLIKKSNQLIESRYKFDIWETRMFLAVLSNIRKDDEDLKPYRIWYRDLIKIFNLKSSQSYAFLRDAAKGLMRKVFNVSSYEDGFRRETEYHIIRSINYLSEDEKGKNIDNQEYIDITIDPDMKPLLLQLQEKYTAYDLKNVINLGAYHVRVYELLKQYESIGHRTLQIEEMKRMLEIEIEYPLFGNFFQKVVKPSVRAINKYTDLTITKMEKVKKGRKVMALYFEFKLKSIVDSEIIESPSKKKGMDLNIINSIKSPEKQSNKDRLFSLFHDDVVKKIGVTPVVFLGLLEHCDEEQVRQALRVTRRAKMNNQIKTNMAGFFVHALKNGYTDTKEEAIKKKTIREQKELLMIQEMEVLDLEKAKNINNRIRLVLNEKPDLTELALDLLNADKKNKMLISKKEEILKRTLVIEDYRQDARLRDLVKEKIIFLSYDQFNDIFQKYHQAIAKLKKKYKQE